MKKDKEFYNKDGTPKNNPHLPQWYKEALQTLPDTKYEDKLPSLSIQQLSDLSKHWAKLARIKFDDAKHEKTYFGQRFIKHGAICYFNCYMQLNELIESWDIPTNLDFDIPKQNTKSPR